MFKNSKEAPHALLFDAVDNAVNADVSFCEHALFYYAKYVKVTGY